MYRRKDVKKLMERKWFFDVCVVALVTVLSTLIMLPVISSFPEWLNAMTDIIIGSVEVLIVTSALEVLLGEKKYRTWQYWVICAISVVAVAMLFIASRSDTISTCIVMLLLSALFTALYAIMRRLFYVPSTWSIEEEQQHVWRKMRTKARKMKRDDFIKMEMDFRCYPTIDGTVESDLDVSAPWATVHHDEHGTVPLTYKGCIAYGKNDVALKIQESLIAELDASGIR